MAIAPSNKLRQCGFSGVGPHLIVHTSQLILPWIVAPLRCLMFVFCVWDLGRDALTLGWEEEGSRVVGWAPGSRHTVPRPVIGHQARSSLESRHRPILDTHLTYSTRGDKGTHPFPLHKSRGQSLLH